MVMGAASQHNVLTVDGREPLQKFSQFLYLPWPRGTAEDAPVLVHNSRNGEIEAKRIDDRGQTAEVGRIFRASHDGYSKLGLSWTREVSCHAQGGGFTVRDQVTGAAGHTLRWQWRLADLPWKMNASAGRVETANYQVSWAGLPNGRARLLRADETTARGWWSPHYGSVEPAFALLIEVMATHDIELVTEFSPLVV